MLDSLRASSTGILAKILLGVLVLMFGMWGIGDMLRTSSSKATLATVGSETIGSDDYMRALRREAENIRQIMGDNFSPDILKDPAISHHILKQLVDHALLKQESEALGLIPGDADIVQRIRTNPAFQNDKGVFDKALFEKTLQAGHTSEKHYVEQLRQDIGVNLLVDTLTNQAPVTNIAARTLLAAREESRSISLYSLKASAITNLPVPDTAQVKSYYDSHNRDFTAPEYRTVSYVTLSSASVAKDTKISEDALKAAYKERVDEFKHPERRTVEQLLYASKDAADKAAALLKGGKSFEQVGKETDILNKDALSLGKVEHGNIMESAADKVFSLPKDGVTDPIESPFGWHIFRVTAIEPPSTSPFEEARPVLEKDLTAHSADDALNKLSNQFQDALAGGSTLAEAAHDFNLKVETAGPFDNKGNAPGGKVAVGLPDLNKFTEIAFKTEENTESALTPSKGGVYYLLHVDKVTPEHLRPMEEVLDQVGASLQDEEKKNKLSALAIEIGKKFNDPAERNALIEKNHLVLVKKVAIKQNTQSVGDITLPSGLAKDVFDAKLQGGTLAHPTKNGEYLFATVDSIIPAPPADNDPKLVATLKDISKGLESLGKNEIVQEYTDALSKKYPVTVNEPALRAVMK